MLCERPLHVLAHQWRGMPRTAGKGRDNFGRSGGVAERDGDIAQPPFVADTSNRAAARFFQELKLGPGEQVGEARLIESMPDREVFLCRGAGKLVPWTNQLAVIAAENAIADRAAKLHGNCAGEFDGEVGNAATCVEA